MTKQEHEYTKAIEIAIEAQAGKRREHLCLGNLVEIRPEVNALVAKLLDSPVHGSVLRDDSEA